MIRILPATGVLAVAMVVEIGAQMAGPPIPKGPNVLVGRVTEIDSDAPIPGAIVALTAHFDAALKAFDPYNTFDRVTTLTPRSVMTTADGQFMFRDLPAGRYSVAVSAFGYLGSEFPPRLIDLKDSHTPTTVPIRVWKHAAISGRVIDDRGEPVVGVPVHAMRRVMVGGRLMLHREWIDVATDDRGEYRIGQLPPGRYVVGVLPASTSLPAAVAAAIEAAGGDRTALSVIRSELGRGIAEMPENGHGLRLGAFVLQRSGPGTGLSPQGRVLGFGTTFFPGTTSAADAGVVTLSSGESREGVDIPVRFSETVRVSGVVDGPTDITRRFSVRLVAAGGTDSSDFRALGVATAITDLEGRFTFLAVPPGQYFLQSRLLHSSLFSPDVPDGAELSLWASQPLTVGNGDIDALAVTLKPGIRVAGRVEFVDEDAASMAASLRMSIAVRPIGAQTWSTLPGTVQADATFRMPGDAPGRYEVFGAAQGWHLENVSRSGRTVPDRVIELVAEEIGDLVLTFTRTPTRLSGAVSSATAGIDADADVIAFPADTSLWREGIFDSRRVRRMHASSAGAFEFSGLLPGEYYIAAVSTRLARDWEDPLFLERLLPGATKFTLAPRDDKTIALKTMVLQGR